MLRGLTKGGFVFLSFIFLFLPFVSGEIVQSDSNVYYDNNIFDEFDGLNDLETIVFLKNVDDMEEFVGDYQEISDIEDFYGNRLNIGISLDVFNQLINDERVSMVIHEGAFANEESNYEVEYDVEILGQFLVSEWVYVTVDIRDISNITFSREDSGELFEEKVEDRTEILMSITDSVLLTLSNEEFQLEGKLASGRGFYGNITKEGFANLLEDTRVRKIYSDKEVSLAGIIIRNKFLFYPFLIFVFLLVILVFFLAKLKKRRSKSKRK